MSLSPEQIDQRLEGITATDIAAIIGHHPFRSAIDVWREKRGEVAKFSGNDRTRWGNLLEPVIRDDYEQRHGVRVEITGTLEHPDRPWMKATPDGLVFLPGDSEPARGLEIKTHTIRMAGEYGAPGTDEVPAYELCQCMWNMGVRKLPRWDLVAFIDNQPTDYIIDRDDELIAMLVERGERFLVDNIRAGVPPEPDGGEAYTNYLRDRWKRNNGELLTLTGDDDEQQRVFTDIELGRMLREQIADAEAELARVAQRIQAFIGERDGLTWKGPTGKQLKLTWKHSKEQAYVDTGAILRELRTTAALVASAKAHEVAEQLMRHPGTSGELLATLYNTIESLAKPGDVDARHSKRYTNRPFCWPRGWRGPSSK